MLAVFENYIFTQQVRYCQDLNISKDKAAVLVGCISFAQTLGKIFYGRVSDSPRVNRVYLFQLCLLICSVLTFLLPVLTSFEALMAYCWLFGFNNGCFVIHEAVLTRDIVGPGKFAPAYGVMYFIAGLPMMIGPPAAGNNNYSRSACVHVRVYMRVCTCSAVQVQLVIQVHYGAIYNINTAIIAVYRNYTFQ